MNIPMKSLVSTQKILCEHRNSMLFPMKAKFVNAFVNNIQATLLISESGMHRNSIFFPMKVKIINAFL